MKRLSNLIILFFSLFGAYAFSSPQNQNEYSNCMSCHGEKFTTGTVHFIEGNEDCRFCHKVAVSAAGHQTRTIINRILCQSCHGDIEDNPAAVSNHNSLQCVECHDPHGSSEPHLMRTDIVTSCSDKCHTKGDLGLSHPVGRDLIDPNTNTVLTCVSTCHSNHFPTDDKLLQLASMDLCSQCHRDKF